MATRNLTGDDYRRAKELEEARKAGLAPAALDEDGKEINPHIPEYMTTAPWYLNKDQPTLVHQRDWRHGDQKQNKWYDRGVKVFQATKFRKGACENCGSMTHKTTDCLERPRAKGAKWTNKNIAADEKVEDIHMEGFDAKRDRWNGYDTKDYNKVVERYEQLDAIRKEIKQKEEVEKRYEEDGEKAAEAENAAAAKKAEGGAEGADADDDDDDAKIQDDEDTGFSKVEKRVRTTAGGATGSVRNLRIREDTAKYLLNLAPDSAYYDPKSRSMREDPNPEKPENEKTFRGDNFVRRNGDFLAWQQMTLHSNQSHEKGADVHMLANPSMAEQLYNQFKSKEEIAEKYGSAAEKAPDELKEMVATERYVEYNRMGRVVKGQENKAKSRYEEDVFINNHTTVWGSWYKDGTWGFACCHQAVKNSYCTGSAGEAAAAESAAALLQNMEAKAQRKEEEDLEKRKNSKLNDYKGYSAGADVWGSETADPDKLDNKKVEEALKKLDAAEKEARESGDEKRKFNSLDAVSEMVTPEEMEAYRIKKSRHNDPMAKAEAGDTEASMGTEKKYEYL
eukprot:gene17842-24226_t